MQSPLMFFIAFIVVLALIGLATWLVRRFAGNRIGNGANRGRLPRLAVIDAAAVDGRRRLVLVRRDNIEHLLMIGGPTDIVVEQNIVRASAQRDAGSSRSQMSEPQWSDEAAQRPDPIKYIEPAPLPEPAQRPARPAFPDEPRRAAPAVERRDPLVGLAPEPSVRPEPVVPREPAPRSEAPRPAFRAEPTIPRPPRPEPKAPRIERPAAAAVGSDADKNLAEMAHRLEAALRRPATAAPAAASPAPAVEAEPAPARPAEDTPRSQFKNLEDEMASLLGRPKSPT